MSQNLRVALWVPPDRINAGESVVAKSTAGPGTVVDTELGISTTSPSTGTGVTISTTPPGSPTTGDVWVDVSTPNSPQVKVFTQSNTWDVLAKGPSMPKATKPDELLTSGIGPNFDWEAHDTLYLGNY